MKMADMARNGLTAFTIAAGMILVFCGLSQAERSGKEQRMDTRELHYDADGDLILMDAGEGLMGIYHTYDPLGHIWNIQIRNMEPGLYHLAICKDRIELWNDDTKSVQTVWLDPEDLASLAAEIADNTPVLVY